MATDELTQGSEGTPVPSGQSIPEAGADIEDRGPCAEQRRVVDERCGLYDRLREQAETMAVELREMQRAYDAHSNAAERAAAIAEPRALRAAKEGAQIAFRRARQAAASTEALETAATDWLQEINRINRSAREALTRAHRERSAASALITRIERMTVETDASRIRAESAMEACLIAREQLSTCEERAARAVELAAPAAATTAGGIGADPSAESSAHQAVPGGGMAAGVAAGALARAPDKPPTEVASPFGPQFPTDEGELATAAELGEEPAILALLRGDSATLRRLAEALAGDDPVERRRWQLLLGEMAEVIVARAIDAAYLIYPEDHPFWGPFTRAQCRAVSSALASLGFRFDGLGGFADDRVPTYRDLSLAVGYAGLDPKRIRAWPTDAEAVELYRDVSVAAGEYLAEAAGGLTLGEMISLLGRRADPLTDLWNSWGRIRVLLLAP